jgi:hypothetical protein
MGVGRIPLYYINCILNSLWPWRWRQHVSWKISKTAPVCMAQDPKTGSMEIPDVITIMQKETILNFWEQVYCNHWLEFHYFPVDEIHDTVPSIIPFQYWEQFYNYKIYKYIDIYICITHTTYILHIHIYSETSIHCLWRDQGGGERTEINGEQWLLQESMQREIMDRCLIEYICTCMYTYTYIHIHMYIRKITLV